MFALNSNRKMALVMVGMVVVGIGGAKIYDRVRDSDPVCVAGPNEKCPDVTTLRIGDDIKELQAELSTPDLTKKAALLQGYMGFMNGTRQQVGMQYHYDYDKRKWVASETPPPAQAAAPAATPPGASATNQAPTPPAPATK